MHLLHSTLGLLALAVVGICSAPQPRSSTPVSTVFQLGSIGTWFENLAIRTSGTILATRLDTPELWAIDPFAQTGSKLLEIPGFTGLLGIVEIHEGVFIVSTGNFSLTDGPVAGTAHVYEVDLRGSQPVTSLVASLPEAGLLNGVTKWDDQTVLITDSFQGVVYKLDAVSGQYSIAISDDTMTFPTGAELLIGVNGVKVLGSFVYYTNTAREILCRVPVDDNANPSGAVEIVAEGLFQDDFTILPGGTAYVATNAQNSIVRITPDGNATVVAGNLGSLELASATSCQFGRTTQDSETLYVTTAGGMASPVNGTLMEPAAIVAVDLAQMGL